jgi:maltose alpha-D-glucosyltransferase/alpha-amylase
VEINRPEFAGFYAEDLFSHNRFPVIKDSPYVLLLGPYAYYLLQLKKEGPVKAGEPEPFIPALKVDRRWEEVIEGLARERLEREILPGYFQKCTWFAETKRRIMRTKITEVLPLPTDSRQVLLLFVELTLAGGETSVILFPLHFAAGDEARRIAEESGRAIVARLSVEGCDGVLCDGMFDPAFRAKLFEIVSRGKRFRIKDALIAGHQGRNLRPLLIDTRAPDSQILHEERESTTILFSGIYFFKFFRNVVEGMNPEAEMSRFLTDIVDYPGSAPFGGTIEVMKPGAEPVTLALLEGFIPNPVDALTFTLDELSRYFDNLLSRKEELEGCPLPAPVGDIECVCLPDPLQEIVGGFYPEMMELLGKRSGEMHLALASRPEIPDFAPEPISTYYQRSIYQSMRSTVRKALSQLARSLSSLPIEIQAEAERLLAMEKDIFALIEVFLVRKFHSTRIRIHGDYRLEHVLFTGKDFMVIDFAGEPAQVISERRIKRSPLQDVAGMLRSFHYAAYTVLVQKSRIRTQDVAFLQPWAEVAYQYTASIFLRSYLRTVYGADFIPWERDDKEAMLSAFMVSRALREVLNELVTRPDWLMIPIRGVVDIMENPTVNPGPVTVD